jgi:aspartate/methionine/tyrosine aminotransferase
MNDMQIVRNQDGGFNLALGEPFFIIDSLVWTHNLKVNGPFYYPLFSGDKDLLEELQLLYPGKHIVVTNGCKQAIAASLYAFKEVEGHTTVHFPAPYWISYPTMVKSAGMAIEYKNEPRDVCKFLSVDTLINNPDGREATDEVDLLDCAYAHKVYGYNSTTMPKHRVSVWSAAKLFGLSGLRIGWAVFDDPVLAKKAALFAEITTSGVSSVSQQYMAKVLKHTRQHPEEMDKLYADARRILSSNADVFNELIAKHCSVIKGASTDGRGMFAYFKVEDHIKFESALKESRVLVVTGTACGEKEPGWYRMSLGHRHDFTVKALEKLGAELNR